MTSRPTWTDEQLAAIQHVDGALLLSAAAGSGKTAVLANRCVHLVCDASPPCEVDELLVVTFTRAAAAEMRERIEAELHRRVRESPVADERLERQLRLIDRAVITTIDAFCADVVRSHFHLVGVDPGFAVLAAEDARLLQQDVCDALLESEYDGEDAEPFKTLLDGYFNGDDARLKTSILDAHATLESLVDPTGWVTRALRRLDAGTQASPAELTRELASRIQDHLQVAIDELDAVAASASLEPKLAGYVTHAGEIARELRERLTLIEAFKFTELAERLKGYEHIRMPMVRGDVPGKEAAQARINAVKDSMKVGPLRNLGRWTWDDLRRDAEQVRGAATTFFDITRRFADGYGQSKRRLRAMDFSEIQRLALQVLSDDVDGQRPSRAAAAVQSRFKHVLVDEFQDVSPMQSAILRLASRDRSAELMPDAPASNLFAVGDVKQSVYSWRQAEPRLFVERDKALREAVDGRGRVIDLQHNFRSRAPLLDAINDVFARLMTATSADVDYDDTHKLRAGANYPPADGVATFIGKPIEMHVLLDKVEAQKETAVEDDEEGAGDVPDRFDREVAIVARRIRELVCRDPGARRHVMVKGPDGLTPRPIGYGDIAVILRSVRQKSSIVADALAEAGIPVHSEDKTGFFNATEVQDVCSLLSVLSNLRQDVPLAAVLRSPLLPSESVDDALAAIRIEYPDEPFHRAVVRFAAESHHPSARRVAEVLSTLGRWRREVQERSIVDALNDILAETNYATFCRALPQGEQRVANLARVLELAATFDTFERQGLDRFLRFLRDLEVEDQVGRPTLASGSNDVVRVMSVHKSKGLEFPVVIVPDLGKKWNETSLKSPVLIERDAGIGMKGVDLAKRVTYPTAAMELVKDRLRRKSRAEEIRVLYVAFTRAREHLILVGTASKKAADKWAAARASDDGRLPDDLIQAAAAPLDWIGPIAAMTTAAGLGTFEVIEDAGEADDSAESDVACAPKPADERLTAWLAESVRRGTSSPAPPHALAAVRRITFDYPHAAAAALKATAAVTDATVKTAASRPAVSRPVSHDGGVDAPRGLEWPEAYQPRRAPRATDIGSAIHCVLQSIDFTASLDDDAAVASQIDTLVERHAISADDATLVDPAAIRWFASTSLGLSIRDGSAGRLLREQPLAFARPVADAVDSDDFVLVRGRIDAMLVNADGITLIDYKSDRVDADQLAERAAVYAPQLLAYATALSRIAARPVIASYAVFLTARAIVSIDAFTGDVRIVEAGA